MTVTAADVAGWAKISTPTGADLTMLERVISAVAERATEAFGFDADPAAWTEFQNQVALEVAAEQYIAGRNSVHGVAAFEDGPVLRANTIDYALKRRVSPTIGFA